MSRSGDEQPKLTEKYSFWHPNGYKRTVKRIDDGFSFSTRMKTFVRNRAKIERNYANNLKSWSKKWHFINEPDFDYGTRKPAWNSLSTETTSIERIHSGIQKRLEFHSFERIKIWEKNFNKNCYKRFERRQNTKMFEKAQKPYVKRLKKVEKMKKKYHAACFNADGLLVQVRHASTESTKLSSNQIKKMGSYIEKAVHKMNKQREEYEEALIEVTTCYPNYEKEMKSLFLMCQRMEETKFKLFHLVLLSIANSLKVMPNQKLAQIYEDLHQNIENINNEEDLRRWSKYFGYRMEGEEPEFVSNKYEEGEEEEMNKTEMIAQRTADSTNDDADKMDWEDDTMYSSINSSDEDIYLSANEF